MQSKSIKVLKGFKFQDSTIQDVTYGKADTRVVLLKNGKKVNLQKSEIAAMCRGAGLQAKTKEYESANPRRQKEMLAISKQRQKALVRGAIEKLFEKGKRANPKQRKKIDAEINRLRSLKPGNLYEGKGATLGQVYPNKYGAKDKRVSNWVTIRRGFRKIRIPVGKK